MSTPKKVVSKETPKIASVTPASTITPTPTLTETTLVYQPILLSMGFTKEGNLWKFYKIKTQGDRVLSSEFSTGDTKFIALEKFKLEVVKEFLEKDYL